MESAHSPGKIKIKTPGKTIPDEYEPILLRRSPRISQQSSQSSNPFETKKYYYKKIRYAPKSNLGFLKDMQLFAQKEDPMDIFKVSVSHS